MDKYFGLNIKLKDTLYKKYPTDMPLRGEGHRTDCVYRTYGVTMHQ